MSVVGFDIGNENCYIAAVKSGGIEILDNEYSLRSTPSYVAFSEVSREAGNAAKAKLTTNLENTVFGFKRILGINPSDPNTAKELEYLPFEVDILPSANIGIKVNYLKNTVIFSVTQLMSMMLTKLKMITKNKLCCGIRDCVISVPVYYTDAQRRAMLDAAKIANLNPLRLMNESIAVALAYGYYKQDLSDQAQNVVFVDLGNSAITVTACSFTKEKLKILGCVWEDIGGRDFDNILVQYFVGEFSDKYRIDVMESKKALMSLMLECESLKKLMSANSLELGIQIECFWGDIDFKGRMKREKFEKLSIELLDKVEKNLSKILEKTQLSVNNIHSVEIVGGSCRLPAVKHLIKKVFGREPNSTLNLDEAVARGCALQCALLSPSLKTRDFVIEDAAPFVIKVAWINMDSKKEELEIFSLNDKVPTFKMISIPMAKPFCLEAFYIDPRCPSKKCEIGFFKIDNIPGVVNGHAKIKIKSCLNMDGIFSIAGAEMVLRNDRSEKRVVLYEDKNISKKDLAVEDEKGDISEKEEKSLQSYELSVSSDVPRLSEEELNRLTQVEKQMICEYFQEKERADARNALEEYIYDVRGKLGYELNEYVKEADKTRLLDYIGETESWLYDNELQEAVEFSRKLREFKKHFEPIFKRYIEWEQRSTVAYQYRHTLRQALNIIDELVNLDNSKVYQSQIENLKKMWQNCEQFLDQSMEVISKHEKFEDVTPTTEDFRKTLTKFQNEFWKFSGELRQNIKVSQESTESSSTGDENPIIMGDSKSCYQSCISDDNQAQL